MDRVLIEYGKRLSTDLSFGTTKSDIGDIASKGEILSSDGLITLATKLSIGKVTRYRSKWAVTFLFIYVYIQSPTVSILL